MQLSCLKFMCFHQRKIEYHYLQKSAAPLEGIEFEEADLEFATSSIEMDIYHHANLHDIPPPPKFSLDGDEDEEKDEPEGEEVGP